MSNKLYHGVYTAVVTPFLDGVFDALSFQRLINKQIDFGVSGVVIAGTTGESATVSESEVCQMVMLCRDVVEKREVQGFKIIVGAGSNNTSEVIRKINFFSEIGVSDFLVMTPSYNKPMPKGLLLHFQEIHQNTCANIILYDVPGRVVTRMSDDLILELSQLERIVAIKDCGRDINRIARLCDANIRLGSEMQQVYGAQSRSVLNVSEDSSRLQVAEEVEFPKKSIEVICGDDDMILPYAALGVRSCISVASNVLDVNSLYDLIDIDMAAAICKHRDWLAFYQALFIETSPAAVKYMLACLNILSSPELRLPMVELSSQSKLIVDGELKNVL